MLAERPFEFYVFHVVWQIIGLVCPLLPDEIGILTRIVAIESGEIGLMVLAIKGLEIRLTKGLDLLGQDIAGLNARSCVLLCNGQRGV